MLPSHDPAAPTYELGQPAITPQTEHHARPSSRVSSQYGTPYEDAELLQPQPRHNPRKRSQASDNPYDCPPYQTPIRLQPHVPSLPRPQGSYSSSPQPGSIAIHHHHHRLPNQPPPTKTRRIASDPIDENGPPSVVGQPGMPAPAPRPKGPKLKFTAEDDALLVELKETRNLSWKQIADFFPGRSSGTLQVRYCTKLKVKSNAWTDETVQKLRTAIMEYEQDKWRIISGKVGTGFSAVACKDKAEELEAEAMQDQQRGLMQQQEEGEGETRLATSSKPP
ncbi:hypothetical protein K470DRAFT_223787 [Piedraia hortae CBS 480.64]|uniref:Myb-like domain-containing protein n=1 Tax=Piedraia hortae CBS 480.64 TaxID=1314780 RepID=A0A6A7BRB7_9PEZI|nr:hypothetical protein K470DRAFT_223787 [Piedraia hortae CBS 480.64]